MSNPPANGKNGGMNEIPLALPSDYGDWLTSLKQRIQGARQRALLAVNGEQIRLYHDIGRDILDRQIKQGWGAKVIDRLSSDLRAAFPDMKGLSASNLKYMRFCAQESPDFLIGQQSADQLPWFHIVTLITKLSDPALRDWYAREALQQSWPRDTLSAKKNTFPLAFVPDRGHKSRDRTRQGYARKRTLKPAGRFFYILGVEREAA